MGSEDYSRAEGCPPCDHCGKPGHSFEDCPEGCALGGRCRHSLTSDCEYGCRGAADELAREAAEEKRRAYYQAHKDDSDEWGMACPNTSAG